jgi:DNA-directed RNA polymerase subunit RPC12/RpoP
MKGIDFFNSMEHLEPRCPKCDVKIEWGVNTVWDEKKEAQVCMNCGSDLG